MVTPGAVEVPPGPVVDAPALAPGVDGWPTWTVPVDESAVCGPPENAWTVPVESVAVCGPPLPACGVSVTAGELSAEMDPLARLVGASKVAPGVAGWPT